MNQINRSTCEYHIRRILIQILFNPESSNRSQTCEINTRNNKMIYRLV